MLLSKTFNALSDPTRQKILKLLKKKDMTAGELAKRFDMTRPSLSHHLNILKEAELVSSVRQGQMMVYSLNLTVFDEISQTLIQFFKK